MKQVATQYRPALRWACVSMACIAIQISSMIRTPSDRSDSDRRTAPAVTRTPLSRSAPDRETASVRNTASSRSKSCWPRCCVASSSPLTSRASSCRCRSARSSWNLSEECRWSSSDAPANRPGRRRKCAATPSRVERLRWNAISVLTLACVS